MKPSKYEVTDYQLKKVLHEPLAPYVASVYNTLIHLVQGLVLAALFYVISLQTQITPIIVCNLIISFAFVITIWYEFITDNQYHVIRTSISDVIIPIVLAVCQVILALAINQPIYIFTLLVIPVFIMIDLSYVNGYLKNKGPMAYEVFKEHYKELGLQFAQDVYDESIRYQKEMIPKIFMATIVVGILTMFNYYFPLNLAIKTYISTIIIGIFLTIAVYDDLNHYFNNSEKLKKYGYKW
jgi:hypothetical protein